MTTSRRQAYRAAARNYITPQGYARLRAELLDLIDNERPKVVEDRALGRAATATARKTATTSTARSACARSTGASAS
jgi:transcription elongation GreA/GreB family factor